VLAITAQWLGFAISIGVSVVSFGWALAMKVKLSRRPSAPIGRAGIRQLNRETAMYLAAFIGCLAVLVALLIFNLAGLGP
jgi:hypothetical protein